MISGGFLFCSGQIALDPKTGELVQGDMAAQTEQVMKNLLAVLKEAKMGPENVVKTTVYLADMADFAKMNEVYGRYLGRSRRRAPPSRRPACPRASRSRSTSSRRSSRALARSGRFSSAGGSSSRGG